MIVISACLCGCNCKYNGKNNINEQCVKILKSKKAILICPEQLGGMSTPRHPAEIVTENNLKKVVNNMGDDVTKEFVKGAKEAFKLAKLVNADIAILKEGSPSCGSNFIYDGSFTGKKIEGMGLTAKLFFENGIKVYSEKEIPSNILETINLTNND